MASGATLAAPYPEQLDSNISMLYLAAIQCWICKRIAWVSLGRAVPSLAISRSSPGLDFIPLIKANTPLQ